MNENVQHPHGIGQCDRTHEQIEKRFSYHLSMNRQATWKTRGPPIDARLTSSKQIITRYVSCVVKVFTGKRCLRLTDFHGRHPACLFSLSLSRNDTSRATGRGIMKLPFASFSPRTNHCHYQLFLISTLRPGIRCACLSPHLILSQLILFDLQRWAFCWRHVSPPLIASIAVPNDFSHRIHSVVRANRPLLIACTAQILVEHRHGHEQKALHIAWTSNESRPRTILAGVEGRHQTFLVSDSRRQCSMKIAVRCGHFSNLVNQLFFDMLVHGCDMSLVTSDIWSGWKTW